MTINQNLAQVRIIDPILTERAQGYRDESFIWNRLFPPVPVTASGGMTLEFGAEAFRLYNTKRAPGASTTRITFGYAGRPYALLNDAVEVPLAREHIRDASEVPGIDLAERAVNLAMRVLNRNVEKEAADLARSPSSYESTNTVQVQPGDRWNNYNNSDPFEDIAEWRERVRSRIGLEPRILVMGPKVYRVLQNHPKIIERVKYVSAESITTNILAVLFDLDEVVIGRAVYATNPGSPGANPPSYPQFQDIWGNDVILVYVPRNDGASMEEPSYGYLYQMVGHPIVEEPYYDNNTKSWIYGVSWERVPVITSKIAGFLARDVVGGQ